MNAYNQTDNNHRLYSQKAISIATFFGGPLAAGILVRRNFINLGNQKYGERALSLGIMATMLILLLIYLLADIIPDRAFYPAIPGIYTAIIYLVVEKSQGHKLKEHKSKNLEFYSGWKAAGIGFMTAIIMLTISVISHLNPGSKSFDIVKYNEGITEFTENESIALRVYTQLEDGELETIPAVIAETGIPKWIRNIEIITGLNAMENLPDELKSQNQILIEYCQLRIKAFGLINKAIQEQSSGYDTQIELIHLEIQQKMEDLENQAVAAR
ncbi:MAG: hypothetical protein KFF73_00180 [Cyclobacteriaceae bacterium]|nr:hypothetical protein [Cyclobacteriaceae bacterium]